MCYECSKCIYLQVKFRIAEGLRKEGWHITKHLFTELIILAFGYVLLYVVWVCVLYVVWVGLVELVTV